ncbi:STAS domain-containing protein [Amycolatopsis endophytica]|uniref:Anti-sigma factor antagonist n=1 Tax=Amycolatopsis endophytica TaxID=860233 RepID=A0A853BDW5_9PSEU|nr:STAS domain-containing protein [Amycolatopsis endophytica]NYI92965.1 anti-anti-sigma factor [Amycolatopsis endophytica]
MSTEVSGADEQPVPPVAGGDLRLVVSAEGSAVIVTATGELDAATSPRFRQVTEHALDAEAAPLVIDLSGLTFLASAGLDALVSLANRDRPFRLVVGPSIRRPLEMTRLDQLLDVYPSLDAALG